MKTKNIFLLAICFILSGCAQVMAIKQPKPFTPTSAMVGAKRTTIIGELGQPVNSEEHTNSLTDTFKYVDGGSKNSGGSKTVRIILYTGGDLFTVFLDQIIWIPTEKFGFAGIDHVLTIDYTKSGDDPWRAATVNDQALKGRSSKKEDF